MGTVVLIRPAQTFYERINLVLPVHHPLEDPSNEQGPFAAVPMPPIVIATVKLPGFEFLNAALRDSAPFLEEFVPICFGAIHSEGVYHDPNDNDVFGTLATFVDIAELQPVTSIKA